MTKGSRDREGGSKETGMHKFESRYGIGQRVHFSPRAGTGMNVEAYVRAVIFTSGKVRYSLKLMGEDSTIHNVDSSLVFDAGVEEYVELGHDNYS